MDAEGGITRRRFNDVPEGYIIHILPRNKSVPGCQNTGLDENCWCFGLCAGKRTKKCGGRGGKLAGKRRYDSATDDDPCASLV